jgi:hypothetical protein
VTASYKRKLIDKRRTKTAVMRPDAAAERSDLFRFPLNCGAGGTPITAGACAGGAPITAGEEVDGARADLLLNAGDCGNVFKCSGCEYLTSNYCLNYLQSNIYWSVLSTSGNTEFCFAFC